MKARKFDASSLIAPQLGEALEQELRSPARKPTPRSDWATPLLQSVTISVLLGLLFGGVLLMAEKNWRLGAGTFAAVFLMTAPVTFILLMNRAYRSTFHVLHHTPHRPPEDVRPIVASSSGKYTNQQEAPANVSDAHKDDLDKCPFQTKTMRWFVWWAEREGTGYDVWEKNLGRTRYTAWRDALIKAGWAEWNSYGADGKPAPTQGWRLLAPATTICDKIQQ